MGDHGLEVFCGTFSSLDEAKNRVYTKMLHLRSSWIELDFIDNPVEDQNIIWKSNLCIN
jgi:hypothetical protein